MFLVNLNIPAIVLDWIGYIASLIVLISLLMNSVKRLRWINLVGSVIFAAYGFLIGSLPVGVMNIGIAVINIYYLIMMYKKNDYFTLLPNNEENAYMKFFIDFYQADISKFMELPNDLKDKTYYRYFVLRNTMPAGLFILSKIDDETLEILIDYVTPTYQDFKLGHFIYETQKDHFKNQGFKKFVTRSKTIAHEHYLIKMGFKKQSSDHKTIFVKEI